KPCRLKVRISQCRHSFLSITMESVVDHIKCAICLDSFDSSDHIPRCFPCGHSFGHSCIQGLKQAKVKKCPTCKADVNLSIDPPVNFQLLGILDACKAVFNQNESDGVKPPICSNCHRAHPSLRTCIKCHEHPILCPHCARINHNGHSFLSFNPSHHKMEAIGAMKNVENSLTNLSGDTRGLITQCIDSLKNLQLECQSDSIQRKIESMAESNPIEAVKAAQEASLVIETTKDNIIQVLSPLIPLIEGISYDLAGVHQGKEEREREDSDFMLALSLSMEDNQLHTHNHDLIKFD
ncbi:hypothetical protein PENTCL1PPCAC_11681, partial [Pristionchus entomophagus]